MALAKVVIVEDERVVALHLRQQLARLGYDVPAMATKGLQAIEAIVTHRPDVVLMDIHIEGEMDGIETASRIPRELHIPIIYLTAYSEDSTLERARNTKPYGYLLKPFSERELHATIQMAMERHRADVRLNHHATELTAAMATRTEELVSAHTELAKQTDGRRRAEQALSQAQKMEAVGHLTGGLAHDFNNLMHVVVGNLDIVMRIAPEEPPRLRKSAASALEAAKKAVLVTQRLLAFSALQPLSPKRVGVNNLVSGMTDLLHRSLEESIGIRTILGAGIWVVEVDPNQLESAVLNLAVNARDAMGGNGSMQIETGNVVVTADDLLELPEDAAPGEYVRVSVADSGCGMDKSTLARACEPFFTTKEIGKGTGLGLSQVYGFVKQSGGFIQLESEVGQGTRAMIYLPRVAGASADTDVRSQKPAGKANGETILVVEDDDDVREFSVDVLEEMGYSVLEAEDGPAALKILGNSSASIDLLFTDIVLPGGMNGVQVAEQARLKNPALSVLFTSGYDRNALAREGRLPAGVELLTKPYGCAELSARVQQMIDRKVQAKGAAQKTTETPGVS